MDSLPPSTPAGDQGQAGVRQADSQCEAPGVSEGRSSVFSAGIPVPEGGQHQINKLMHFKKLLY